MTYRLRLLAAAAVVSLLGIGSAARAQVLSIDDGTPENSVGLNAGATPITSAYLNSFPTTLGGTQVNSVQIAFGSQAAGSNGVVNGTPIMVYLWNDPNGDGSPADAQVLASVLGVISSINTDTFITFALSPTVVTTANFFVGFTINTTGPNAPAALDQSAPTFPGRSYVAGGGTLNPNALGAASFFNTIEGAGAPGNLLIRADVTAVPEPATVLGGALAVGALGWHLIRRRRVPAGA